MSGESKNHNALPDNTLELVAARFKVLSEPMRLKLLRALMSGELTVTELIEATGAGQANVSKHLSSLADAGIVGRRKEGLNVHYSIVDPSIFSLCDLVCGSLREQHSAKAEALEAAASSPAPAKPAPASVASKRRKAEPAPRLQKEPKPEPGPEPPTFSVSFD